MVAFHVYGWLLPFILPPLPQPINPANLADPVKKPLSTGLTGSTGIRSEIELPIKTQNHAVLHAIIHKPSSQQKRFASYAGWIAFRWKFLISRIPKKSAKIRVIRLIRVLFRVKLCVLCASARESKIHSFCSWTIKNAFQPWKAA